MSEGIFHINFYTTTKKNKQIEKTKKHLKEKLGIKTYEEMLLFLCQYWEDHENKTENLGDKTDVEKI